MVSVMVRALPTLNQLGLGLGLRLGLGLLNTKAGVLRMAPSRAVDPYIRVYPCLSVYICLYSCISVSIRKSVYIRVYPCISV